MLVGCAPKTEETTPASIPETIAVTPETTAPVAAAEAAEAPIDGNATAKTGTHSPSPTSRWFPPNVLQCSPASAVPLKSVLSLRSPPHDHKDILLFFRKNLSTFFA